MLNNISVTPTIAVKDLEAGRKFYEQKLGLQPVQSEDDEVLLFKSGNSTIQVYKSEFAGTNKATSLTWGVGEDIEGEVKSLKDKGISFEHYNFPDVKLQGDIHFMGEMKVAWFKDPDGNILCIHNH